MMAVARVTRRFPLQVLRPSLTDSVGHGTRARGCTKGERYPVKLND
jgi:hypothetical protein